MKNLTSFASYSLLILSTVLLSINAGAQSSTTPISINAKQFGVKCDGGTDDSTNMQKAIVAGRSAKVPVYVPAGVCSLGSTGITITGTDTIIGAGMFNTEFTYSGTSAAITATAWTGTLSDFWIWENNAAASGIKIGGGSQKPTIRNIYAQIQGALSGSATGSGLLLDATGDSSFSGGLLVQNAYFLAYKYGVNFKATNLANSWTTVTMYDVWLVGRLAGIIGGGAGIYMDANTDGIGTMLMGGTIESFDYPVYTEDGTYGGVFETDIEGCAHDSRIGTAFNGRVLDAFGNGIWQAANGVGGPVWYSNKKIQGSGPVDESYYSQKTVVTSGASGTVEAWQLYRNASINAGNPVGTYGLKFAVGAGIGSSAGIAVHPSNHYLKLSDVTLHWDSINPATESGSQVTPWTAGSIAYNYAPAVGQPKGWVCTVSGGNTTGTVNSGSTALTVANGTAVLNGQVIRIVGAGTAGDDLVTTVASGGGTASIVLTATASTSVVSAAVYTPGTWVSMGNL